MDIKDIYYKLKAYDTNIFLSGLRFLYFRIMGKNIIPHSRAVIKGSRNITTDGSLSVGTLGVSFSLRKDITYLNIQGKLHNYSNFEIGRGCRFDIGRGAVCELGSGYVNVNSRFVIKHGLRIGYDVAIAWDCEIIDEDFHEIYWEGKKEKDKIIEIGNHVWIGSNCRILKGVKIGNNNVIAANSVVTKSFPEENVLIAGIPARIIKESISWK